MTFITFRRGCLVGMLALATSSAWAEDQAAKSSDANPETASVVGTVTALEPSKHQFTLREDGDNDKADYRPYYRNGNPAAMIEKIAKLVVGDHVTVTYTEHEGRRVIVLDAMQPRRSEASAPCGMDRGARAMAWSALNAHLAPCRSVGLNTRQLNHNSS